MPTVDAPPLRARRSLTRREVLGYAWLVSLAALAGVGLRLGARFARPRAAEGQFGGAFNLGLVSALPAPGSAPRHEPAGRFWLVNTPAGLIGLQQACTHLACLCEWDEQSRQFVCPCHGSRFAEDGVPLGGPAPRALDRFVLRIETPAGSIVAETDPQTGAPLPVPLTWPQAGGGELVLMVDTGRKIQGAPAA
jgi:cytochrome b6-f complex iron-sulfur subunit